MTQPKDSTPHQKPRTAPSGKGRPLARSALLVLALALMSGAAHALNLQYFRSGLLKSSAEDTIYPGAGYVSGTTPFQTSSPAPSCAANGPTLTIGTAANQVPAGDDCPKPADVAGVPQFDNTVVRTHDALRYSYALSTDASAATLNAKITITLAQTTVAPAGRTVAVWNQTIAPPTTVCASVAYSDPVVLSGITEYRTLTCNLGNLPAARRQDVTFNAKVLGSAKNGDDIPPPIVAFSADNNASTSPFVEATAVGSPPANAPAMVVSAAPRWDLVKEQGRFGGVKFIAGSGPNGELGFLMVSKFSIVARGSRKGLEALDGTTPIVMTDSLTLSNDTQGGTAAPGSGPRSHGRLVTWKLNGVVPSPSGCVGTTTLIIPTGTNSGIWDSGGGVNDYNDGTNRSNVTDTRAVLNGGICSATQAGGIGTDISVSISGGDYSLLSYPLTNGSTALVDQTNVDASTNLWYAAMKGVFVWFPIEDFPLTTPATSVTLGNAVSALVAPSVSGTPNVEPIFPTNNQWTATATRTTGGGTSKGYAALPVTPVGSQTSDFARQANGGDVVFVAPGQYYSARMAISNTGTETLTNIMLCEKIDNSRQTLIDLTTAALNGQTVIDNLIITYGGLAQAISVDYGVGGTSGSASTWETQNTSSSSYVAPALTGSAQSDNNCGDADSPTWYSWTALKASGIPLQNVTKVRVKIPSALAGTTLSAAVPLRARTTYAFNVVDNAPGSAQSAGTSTLGAFIPNAAISVIAQLATLANPTGTTRISKNLQVKSTEHVAITKTKISPTTQLVAPSQVLRMQLQPNVTSGTDTHTATITVVDALPSLLTYLPGSTTIGGLPAADPVVTANTPFAGQSTLTWILPNQTVPYAAILSATGNLPAIQFDARVSATAPDASSVLNSATISSPNMEEASCVYTVANQGYKQPTSPVQPCAFSNVSYTVQINNGFNLTKRALSSAVDVGATASYALDVVNVGTGTGLPNAVVVDVLPSTTDGRGTAFSGTAQLSGAVTALADGVADTTAVIKYSKAYTTLPVPLAQLNALSPATASAPDFWCLPAELGSANCPAANLSDAKSFRVERPIMNANTLYSSVVNLKTSGNVLGNKYVNSFAFGYTGAATAATSSSATVTVTSGTISGRVWLDINRDGVFNGADSGIATTLTLTAKNGVDAYGNPFAPRTLTSAADGTYSFTNLPAGEYTVVETQPAGALIDGKDYAGAAGGITSTNDTISGIVLVAGAVAANNNFTEYADATVSGRVYREASAPANTTDNGNATDPGIVTDITISCTSPTYSAGPISTAADGTYTFTGVPAGATCTITQTQPTGYTNAYNTQGTGGTANTGGTAGSSGNSTISLVVPAGGSTGNNFAEQSADTTSATVCTPNPASPGAAVSCTVTCTNNGPGAAVGMSCAVTNAAALPGAPTPTCAPSANVASGGTLVCTVNFTAPSNGSVTVNAGSAASNDTNGGNVATAGNNASTATVNVSTVSVSGRVYREASSPANTADNGNTVDPGIVTNVALSCTTPAFTAGPTATAADGTYSFTGVPAGATCTLTETQPTGYTNAYNTQGAGGTANTGGTAGSSGNSTITLVVPAGGSTGNNFAEQSADTTSATVCTPNPASPGAAVSCTVTCTNNGPGAAVGMSCAVTNAASLPGAPTPTCAPSANVANGGTLVCTVNFNAPSNGSVTVNAGSGASNDSNGGNVATAGNNPSSATVAAGGVNVSGRVYREASTPANTADNGNAVDPGLVTQVSLSCTAPNFSAGPTATNADGTYSFAGVPAGATCTLTETQPAGYTNAYNTLGAGGTGDNSATAGAGTPGDSTITLVVPAGGSTGNNFAEQSADMVSATVCSPSGTAAQGATVTCTTTCTNNGPGAAVNAFCSITNAASLPGSPTATCSPNTTLANGDKLTCTVSFVMSGAVRQISIIAGTGSDNDTNGAGTVSAGNNPSSATLSLETPVPTLSAWIVALLAGLLLCLAGWGVAARRTGHTA